MGRCYPQAMELDTYYGTASDLQDLLAIRDKVDELAQRRAPAGAVGPRVELRDQGAAYEVIAEVPGVTQENLEIAVQGRELIVAGVREPLPEGELIFSERPTGPFQRTVNLPSAVDAERAQARLANGLLSLYLPKR